jgi:hypothetical protein
MQGVKSNMAHTSIKKSPFPANKVIQMQDTSWMCQNSNQILILSTIFPVNTLKNQLE